MKLPGLSVDSTPMWIIRGVTRSLQKTVLPEMRTVEATSYRARGRHSTGWKEARSGNETLFFFFFFFFLQLFSEKQNSGRDKASSSSQHQKKSKIEDQTENLARTTWSQLDSHTVLCLCSVRPRA